MTVLPTPSVTCLTGFPTPAGTLSKPFPARPVTPLTVALIPDVALSVTVLTPPVVMPTPLFNVPVAALVVCPMMPGFFAAGVTVVVFLAAAGVGVVPSGFTVFTGAFLTGVAFVVVVLGVEFAAGSTLEVGGVDEVADETGFFAAATGVFFTGVALDVEALVATGVAFFAVVVVVFAGVPVVPVDVVAFAGVPTFPVVVAGAAVLVELSFAGAFLIGVAAGVAFVADGVTFVDAGVAFDAAGVTFVAAGVVFVAAAGAAFLTGVAAFGVAVEAVFEAVAGVFFAVCCAPSATLERLPTLAESQVSDYGIS